MIKHDYEFRLLVDQLLQELRSFYEEKILKEIEDFKNSDEYQVLSLLEKKYQEIVKDMKLLKSRSPNIQISISNNPNSSYTLKESPFLAPKTLKIVDKHKFEYWVYLTISTRFFRGELFEMAKQEPLENMGLELV